MLAGMGIDRRMLLVAHTPWWHHAASHSIDSKDSKGSKGSKGHERLNWAGRACDRVNPALARYPFG